MPLLNSGDAIGYPPICARLARQGVGQDPFFTSFAGHPPFATLEERGAGQDPFTNTSAGHPPFAELAERDAGQNPFTGRRAGHPPFFVALAEQGTGQDPFARAEREGRWGLRSTGREVSWCKR